MGFVAALGSRPDPPLSSCRAPRVEASLYHHPLKPGPLVREPTLPQTTSCQCPPSQPASHYVVKHYYFVNFALRFKAISTTFPLHKWHLNGTYLPVFAQITHHKSSIRAGLTCNCTGYIWHFTATITSQYRPALSVSKLDDHLDLHQRVFWQPRHFYRRARRSYRTFRREIRSINLVHRREIFHALQKDNRLHHLR
jgi:hypothetical protein